MSTFVVVIILGAIVLLGALVYVYRLIMTPADESEPDADEVVAIIDGLGEMQAEVFRSKLGACGIDAFTRNSHIAPTLAYGTPFGWEVLVRYGDRIDAERCLGQKLLTSEPDEEDVEAEEST